MKKYRITDASQGWTVAEVDTKEEAREVILRDTTRCCCVFNESGADVTEEILENAEPAPTLDEDGMVTYSLFMLPWRHPDRFMCYDSVMTRGGVKIREYETVYTGRIEPRVTLEATLAAIFVKFNLDRPGDYTGRSMSVSDLIALEGTGTYFCDSFGFKQIN